MRLCCVVVVICNSVAISEYVHERCFAENLEAREKQHLSRGSPESSQSQVRGSVFALPSLEPSNIVLHIALQQPNSSD